MASAIAAGRDAYRQKLLQRMATCHHNARLTDDAVRQIRSLYAAGGATQRDLAHQFGVSKTRVSLVVRRRAWKHI